MRWLIASSRFWPSIAELHEACALVRVAAIDKTLVGDYDEPRRRDAFARRRR